jgi:hypothetical protein
LTIFQHPRKIVHRDLTLPGFGLKITPKGRKVFIVLCRAGGGGSPLRNTRSDHGRITLHNARMEAQKILAAPLRVGIRRPKSLKPVDRSRPEVINLYGKLHNLQRRSGREVMQILRRNLVDRLGSRSIHGISKRSIIDLVSSVVDRG